MATAPSNKRESPGRDYNTATLLLFLLLVGIGVMTWYWTSDGAWAPARTESVPAPAAAPLTEHSAASRDAPRPPAVSRYPIYPIYLVESEAAAGFARAVLSGAATPRDAHSVVVVAAGEEAAAVFSEEQRLRAEVGLPALTIVDLRPEGRFEPYP